MMPNRRAALARNRTHIATEKAPAMHGAWIGFWAGKKGRQTSSRLPAVGNAPCCAAPESGQGAATNGRQTVLNVPGSRVWTTIDGVFIAWTQGAAEVIELIARDGMPIPRSADTLAGVLQSHGLTQKPPSGDLYWVVTPHPLMRDGRGPALKCIRLDANQLYPATLVPPPVSVTLGREGQQQQQLIAPNAAPAQSMPAAAASPEPAATASSEALEPMPAVEEDPLAAVCGPLPGARPAKPDATAQKPVAKPAPKQQPNLPAAASAGIQLVPSTSQPVEEAAPPVNPDTQPEEAEAETFSLDAMLLGLTPQTAGPETRAEKLPALLHKAA